MAQQQKIGSAAGPGVWSEPQPATPEIQDIADQVSHCFLCSNLCMNHALYCMCGCALYCIVVGEEGD